ncbi:hypothetical protein AMTR_s00127p00081220 [Amborella trichopoda]|uniref:Uncharacterized protein n=1 Tax=Amborella trichopoda TaxID=13333 RepID=W1NNN6_AMBTC|nr:hypothetical protein AMTR_s00127p00081220 [Amborella trichopoda]
MPQLIAVKSGRLCGRHGSACPERTWVTTGTGSDSTALPLMLLVLPSFEELASKIHIGESSHERNISHPMTLALDACIASFQEKLARERTSLRSWEEERECISAGNARGRDFISAGHQQNREAMAERSWGQRHLRAEIEKLLGTSERIGKSASLF